MSSSLDNGPQVSLVGYGAWGKNIAKTLKGLSALKCVVDPSYPVGSNVEGLDVPYQSFDEVLADQDIEALAIATPTPTHFELALKALGAGKHVFLEKPFVASPSEINQLENVRGNLTLMVGHLMIYHPAFQKMKALVSAGKVGKIIKIETARRNYGKIHPHEGVLWDIGPHDLSMVYHLLGGLPKEVLCEGTSYLYPSHHDTVRLILGYEGASAEIGLSRIHPFKEQKVTVIGSKGTLVLDDVLPLAKKLAYYAHDIDQHISFQNKGEPSYVAIDAQSPLQNEMEHFLMCIKQGGDPVTNAKEARDILTVILSAERSNTEKRAVLL